MGKKIKILDQLTPSYVFKNMSLGYFYLDTKIAYKQYNTPKR
jgi:hypothetical protein